ncbi:MAG: hydantoinase/oxoprolinase family protein, partial [Alphaproteobacteria bacterium]
PPSPGVLCAQGLLAADLKADMSRTVALPVHGATPERLSASFSALEHEADEWFDAEAIPRDARTTRRVALMRYEEQGHELAIAWPAGADAGAIDGLVAGFEAAHRALYGFILPEAAIEIVTLRVEATSRAPAAPARSLSEGGSLAEATIGRQAVRFADGARAVPIIDRSRLGAGARFDGPAIVTQLDATTLVLPGQRAAVDRSGAILVTEGRA